MRPLRFSDLVRAIVARREMRFERLEVFALENAERVEVEIFLASWMSAHGCNFFFSDSTAERRRVFTVPNGSPVRAAISLCVKPSKYASSMASRCS